MLHIRTSCDPFFLYGSVYAILHIYIYPLFFSTQQTDLDFCAVPDADSESLTS